MAGYENIEFDPSTLTLISLVHLSDEEIKRIQSSIGTTRKITSVAIHNWPNPDEPCTRAELYYIFQAIKPSIADPELDETFALFLDKNWDAVDTQTDNDDNRYHVLCAYQIVYDNHDKKHYQNTIDIFSLVDLNQAPLKLWHMIWHPFGAARRRMRVHGARINYTPNHQDKNETFTKGAYTDVITNPEKLVLGSSGAVVFILDGAISSNAKNLREIRDYLSQDWEGAFVFYDVSRYLETADVHGLVTFLESEKYLATNKKSPYMFMAVNQTTLQMVQQLNEDQSEDSMEEEEEKHETKPIIFGAQEPLFLDFKYDDDGSQHGTLGDSPYEYLGYAYGSVDAETAYLTWVNLDIANLNFPECVTIEGHIYWGSPALKSWVEEHFEKLEVNDYILNYLGVSHSEENGPSNIDIVN